MRNHNEQKLNNLHSNEASHCEIPSNQVPEVLYPSSPTWTWMDHVLLCNPERNTWDWETWTLAACEIHTSYLWGNHFIVSNVNVDYFSRCRLAQFVYLQQAVCEFLNLKVCSFLLTKDLITCSFCPTDHNLRSPPPPCHSYATSRWWAQTLSCSRSVSKGKTHSRITRQSFPCLLTHSRTKPTGTVQQLTHEPLENVCLGQRTVGRSPLHTHLLKDDTI